MWRHSFNLKAMLVAIISAPAISALIATPLYILRPDSFQRYGLVILFGAFLVLVFWAMNLALLLVFKKQADTRATYWLVSYTVSILFAFLFGHVVLHPVRPHDTPMGWSFHFHMILFVSINTVILLLINLMATRDRKGMLEQEVGKLQLKHAEALQRQLQLQAQPHFVYNSLSTLKALMRTNPDLAEEYLLLLADYLRYASSFQGEHIIPLAKELALCRDYLRMQQIRFGDALQFEINVPEADLENAHVPLLALQQLVENSIKHNYLTREHPLLVTIEVENGWICTRNNLQQRTARVVEGTGLANLKARYHLLSGPAPHIEMSDGTFSVRLKIL